MCVTELEQEDGFPSVPIELVDPNVARIFAKSRRGKVRHLDGEEVLGMGGGCWDMGRRVFTVGTWGGGARDVGANVIGPDKGEH